MLSNDTQMLPHKQGLHDHQNPTNEQLTIGSEEVTMPEVKTESTVTLGHSETNENANELTNNGSEHRASNEEHLRNTVKETAGRDNNEHDAKKLADDSEFFSLPLTNSLGFDEKGFDCKNKESTSCSPDQVTVAKVDEVNMNYVLSKSSEQNHEVEVSETVTNKKPSVVSCNIEAALPTTAGPRTVRAWLKDSHLYKVIPLSSSSVCYGLSSSSA